MPVRPISSRQDRKNRRWREHIDRDAARSLTARLVTVRRPAQQRVTANRESPLLQRDERTIRQGVDLAPVQTFGAPLQTLGVQHVIHLAGFWGRGKPARLSDTSLRIDIM